MRAQRATSGTTIEQMSDKGALDDHVWRRVVLASLLFVLGFTTVFVALGAGASVLGQWVQVHKGELSIVAGLGIGVYVAWMLPLLRQWLSTKRRRLFRDEGFDDL